MSIEVVAWALNHAPVEDAGPAAVLLGLANHADPDGSNAWPSVERLAYYARMNERTVRRHLRTLEEAGVIVRDEDTRSRDAVTRGDQRPYVYRLLIDGPRRETYDERRARQRAEAANGGSDCPPVADLGVSDDGGSDCPGGQIDRGDNDDTTGGQGAPQTVLDPSLSTYSEGVSLVSSESVEQPPQDIPDGIQRVCRAHQVRPATGPCGRCADWRRAADTAVVEAQALAAVRAQEARIEAAEAARRARELTDAEVRACGLCNEHGRLPTGLVCLHDPTRNPRPDSGGYAAFQELRARGVKRSGDGRDPAKGRKRALAEREG